MELYGFMEREKKIPSYFFIITKGATPLEVFIKNNKVVKVEALPNHEGPKFLDKVKQGLFPKFSGLKVSKAAKASSIDGVTGATYTSRAVKENIAAAVAYYKKNK